MSDDEARDDAQAEAQDWRRVALTLTDALDAAHAEIRRLRGGGLPVEPVPTPVKPTPTPADPPMTQPLRGRLERLRKIREGATIIGPGPTDSGFAVGLVRVSFEADADVGWFALTRLYFPDTGTWQGQGPLRTVEGWAAEGWDITNGGRA